MSSGTWFKIAVRWLLPAALVVMALKFFGVIEWNKSNPFVKKDAVVITDPFISTYQPFESKETLIKDATVLTGTGEKLENTSILLKNGKIEVIGKDVVASRDATIIDAKGQWVTPGFIDVHSHLGVYPAPGVESAQDGNEMSSPVTAEVWAEHSVWPQDPNFAMALAGGVTSLQILPGSANLIGGRGVTVKNVPVRTVQAMKFPGAPHSLKVACGENPKRVYGEKGQAPSTRMGNVAGYRKAWIRAQDYKKLWDEYYDDIEKGKDVDPPSRDLELDTLADVLRGKILVHNHCYRAEEMAVMIDLAKEFGYKITAFHHAVEAYKVADLLAKEDICSAMWADWWGFKIEAFDHIRENIPWVDKAGACAMIHSDHPVGVQHLNQEVAKAMSAGNKAGLSIAPEKAIKWVTKNPAKALGILEKTGTIEKGKMADVVLWNRNPFSVYAKAEKVYIDGALMYDRHENKRPYSDFDLGIITPQGVRP